MNHEDERDYAEERYNAALLREDMTDQEHRRQIARDLSEFAERADRLADELDAWHWQNVGGIVVAPSNYSSEIGNAGELITGAAGRLNRAATYHAESADRMEVRP